MSATGPAEPAAPTRHPIICPVCLHAGLRGPGPGGRPEAACSRCGSLERHRALAGILPGLGAVVKNGSVADIAPTPLLAGTLARLAETAGVGYLAIDFDPGADSRSVNIQASMTDLPLPAASVGLMICFHVLEHIPDDAAAMREMARVLAPGGLALVQVPRREGVPTDEDPDAPVEERLTRFGQADHVRYYGEDFEDRLRAAGLTVELVRTGDLYDGSQADLLGFGPDEPIWLCSVGARADVRELAAHCATAGEAVLAAGLDALVAERDEALGRVETLRQRLRRVRGRLARAEESEAGLRSRPEVRAAAAVGNRARAVLGRRPR
jgi:SAM-dependent methyltransferase